MKKIFTVSIILAALVLLIFGTVPVTTANEDKIVLSSTAPLMINGIFREVFPVTVDPGTVVSIVDDIYYKSAGERWSFEGWSNGSQAFSFTLTNPETYVAQ